MSESIRAYLSSLRNGIDSIERSKIAKAADILFEAKQRSAAVYVFGNGGSWATAEHFALDLRKWSRERGTKGVRATALTLSPLASAYSNDHDYAEVFSRQLNDLILEGDVVIGISCSGRSQNVLNALGLAENFGYRIGLTGRMGNLTPMAGVTDLLISAPVEDIRQQEDLHLAICHIIAGEVRNRIAQETTGASDRVPAALED